MGIRTDSLSESRASRSGFIRHDGIGNGESFLPASFIPTAGQVESITISSNRSSNFLTNDGLFLCRAGNRTLRISRGSCATSAMSRSGTSSAIAVCASIAVAHSRFWHTAQLRHTSASKPITNDGGRQANPGRTVLFLPRYLTQAERSSRRGGPTAARGFQEVSFEFSWRLDRKSQQHPRANSGLHPMVPSSEATISSPSPRGG